MAIISCANCQSDNDIHLEGNGPNGERVLRCGDCGHTWSPVVVTHAPSPALARDYRRSRRA